MDGSSAVVAALRALRSPQDDECPLKSMPPEIRNRIYAYTFATNPDLQVDLLEAKPPPKALLLTCRQMYEEAKHMYRAAYRRFWSETDFKITLVGWGSWSREQRHRLHNSIDALDEEDLSHINGIAMENNREYARRALGLWYFSCETWHSSRQLVVLVPKTIEGQVTGRGYSDLLATAGFSAGAFHCFDVRTMETQPQTWAAAKHAARMAAFSKRELMDMVYMLT